MIFEDGYIYSGVVASKGERISAVLVTFWWLHACNRCNIVIFKERIHKDD